jgi:hypothetical protein
LGLDAETLEIRAIEVTSNRVGDAQVLQDLLNHIPSDERIESVSGDGAYDTKRAHAAIAEREAQAIIPVRENGQPWSENTTGASVRNETLRAMQRLGRAIWKKWSGYHRRSLVETKMRCFKLLGGVSRHGSSKARSLSCKFARHCSIGLPNWAGR